MTKTVKNNLVADIQRDHVLTNRTVHSQLNYEFSRFINSLNYSIGKKLEKIEEIDLIVQDGHTFNESTGSQIEPDWVKLANDRQWNEHQMEVSQMLLDYFEQANSQLFPPLSKETSTSQADAFAMLQKKVA